MAIRSYIETVACLDLIERRDYIPPNEIASSEKNRKIVVLQGYKIQERVKKSGIQSRSVLKGLPVGQAVLPWSIYSSRGCNRSILQDPVLSASEAFPVSLPRSGAQCPPVSLSRSCPKGTLTAALSPLDHPPPNGFPFLFVIIKISNFVQGEFDVFTTAFHRHFPSGSRISPVPSKSRRFSLVMRPTTRSSASRGTGFLYLA